jgi:transposase-like protein
MPVKRSEQALLGVVIEAYTKGVSTRKVERLVEQLGVESMSKNQVSRICQALDELVEAFRNRPFEGAYPYLWLDARVECVRDMSSGMVRQKALLVAPGVADTGRREVIGHMWGSIRSWLARWRRSAAGDGPIAGSGHRASRTTRRLALRTRARGRPSGSEAR